MPDISPEEDLTKERQSLVGLKFLEAIWCLICFSIQVDGLLDKREPFPHEYPVVISYALFTLIPLSSALVQVGCTELAPRYRTEAAVSVVAFLVLLACGFRAMYNVEVDIHMRYLNDREEAKHTFFVRSRLQSIFSIQAAGLFLVHGVFMLDLLGVLDRGAVSVAVVDQSDQKLRLTPFWLPVWHWGTGSCRQRG
ncbi:uncharacterized protein LOC119770305 [Culex quinquefasciatus]|uniref:uncharacterized protein LOC119770305 n=1 Tax=Culex quinquefasciatus TaxID=7176 RepID=UPI0018E38F8E|nr:uncharacterized protein LOC119770305 [Culex quinquefasciatus]